MRTTDLVGAAEFRRACGQFATGVTAVTAADPADTIAALAVNSFTSVSLDPAQVLVCVGVTTSSYPVVSRAARLAVHVLAADQEALAKRLATSGLTGAERLADVAWTPGPGGEPLLAGTAARLAGTVSRRVPSGDHLILIVDVDHVENGAADSGALAFHRGTFAVLPSAQGAEPVQHPKGDTE
ncbi:4-hydroxyphenylacetate 3-monooxygenase reductase component [Actinocorallia herbida]|uniref:4-hydroxyphenylacetate 3-monooxygenase reductase component n=1 Tax=Actinocorallia herbida TaxID=58109 RepID=A0A3N1CX35_9ACTN|nr:flavin reductase family protein [Actinocorallia herbida]ROO85795.1 4-hydroxyphenylacetate 3-monooxygenase reductase component [Actinocorallia herbida]